VFDRDAGITIYVDGISAFRPGTAAGDVGNAGPFLVAKSTGYNYFKGDLDEVGRLSLGSFGSARPGSLRRRPRLTRTCTPLTYTGDSMRLEP
jgi:hypothetical protein